MPSSRRTRLSPNADADFIDIVQLMFDRRGDLQAAIEADLLRKTIADLLAYPNLARRQDDIEVGLRSYPVGQHVISYRVTDNELLISRIIHSRSDIGNKLD